MNLFKKIFKGKQTPAPTFLHPDLGTLRYCFVDERWETDNGETEIYHGGIKGSTEEPDESSIQEIITKLKKIDHYWEKCSNDLRKMLESWDSIPKDIPIKELLYVAALSLYDDYWEVCFQTKPEYKWVYIGMQFEGEKLVSNSIDT